jgi:hypothetical protein
MRPKEFVRGEAFQFLGRAYRLRFTDGDCVMLNRDSLCVPKKSSDELQSLLLSWYKMQAVEKISQRVEYYTKVNGLRIGGIRVTDARKRWGSCGPGGTVNFNWRLVMAPIAVIDYVVIHELAHLEVRNHSAQFWRKVKLMSPKYLEHIQWLVRNGHELKI